MNIDYKFFKVDDGLSLAYKVWDKVETPVGVVILIHGMAEHIERYDSFAVFLNSKGFIVYGADQRGHGKTSGKKGMFSSRDGDKKVITDQFQFYNFVKTNHPDLKISYMAHSMGSYIARNLITTFKIDVDKIILSGTGYEPPAKATVACLLANSISRSKPAEDAIFLDKMVNGPFAESITNPITKFDWLSRDNDQVAKYVNDSNCGYICTNKFYSDFFKIIKTVCSTRNIKKIDKDLPILLYSGEKDPVGGKNACNVIKLYDIYTSLGLNVSMSINKDGRHESLNETNKEEVYDYFVNFLLGVNPSLKSEK
ncbi:MAG: alpha/beta hydrolase [Spirochaetaceae bacterium]